MSSGRSQFTPPKPAVVETSPSIWIRRSLTLEVISFNLGERAKETHDRLSCP